MNIPKWKFQKQTLQPEKNWKGQSFRLSAKTELFWKSGLQMENHIPFTAPDGYEIAEDVTFTLKDTMEVQKVEMKDARTPEKTTEKTNAPKTGDNQKVWAFILLGLASAGTAAGVTVYRRKKSKMTENKEETEEK